MPFDLRFTTEARDALRALEADAGAAPRLRRVRKALAFLSADPRHPGLRVHQFHSLSGPGGETVWEAYVENQSPGAWRVWFWYGPERGQITIIMFGPHPN